MPVASLAGGGEDEEEPDTRRPYFSLRIFLLTASEWLSVGQSCVPCASELLVLSFCQESNRVPQRRHSLPKTVSFFIFVMKLSYFWCSSILFFFYFTSVRHFVVQELFLHCAEVIGVLLTLCVRFIII